jgi:hypothetical protein
MRCSKAKDMKEWNEWREANPDEKILLEGAGLEGAHLKGADLWSAHLKGANLIKAHLEGAGLRLAHLEEALLMSAHLEGADLWLANLKGAAFQEAHLEGAYLMANQLAGADFTDAVVNGKTLLAGRDYDKETDFTGVGLRSARVRPELRSALEANVRRRMWRQWYRDHWPLAPFVKFFWSLSDYGTSACKLMLWFLGFAMLFAAAYWCSPDLVSGLDEADGVQLLPGDLPLRAVYFSVITMTTLGFGDMHAAAGNPWGHLLLMVQVILGYILLGALITRFAIMFQEA